MEYNDAKQILKDAPKTLEWIQRQLKISRSKYFWEEELLRRLLYECKFDNYKKSTFIDYNSALKYYKDDSSKLYFSINGKETEPRPVPYSEVVNFIKRPKSQIIVEGEIGKYKMPAELKELTEYNLSEFLGENKRAFDNSVVRVSKFWEDLSKHDSFKCKLEKSTYFYQARTNLTLDLPLPGEGDKTLRVMDLDENGSLREFEDSLLLNSIGISACVYYMEDQTRKFFLKPRKGPRSVKGGTSVFSHMLGTVSGVMEATSTRIRELVSYAQAEMRREFERETGLGDDNHAPVGEVIPLAFCRELVRGGKPQFFFLIKINPISDAKFKARFRNSLEGLEEFQDGLIKNRIQVGKALSPESAMNLYYAFQYIQNERKVGIEPIEIEI